MIPATVIRLTARSTLLAVTVAVSLALAPVASAQQADVPSDDTTVLEQRKQESREEYERVAREIALSQERRDKFAAEVDALKKDQVTLTAALIQAAKTEKKLTEDIDDISGRLIGLREQQDGVRASLTSRRAVLGEVLAALQRMGLNPPPALLVVPEDALAAVRSAILLGAVVPELRSETEILLTDLSELARVSASITAERERLQTTVGDQIAERERLNLLLAEKQALRDRAEGEIEAERARSEELAERATSMQQLIESLESEITSVREALDARKRAAELARQEQDARPVPEANRLSAALPFGALKDKLLLPVSGEFVRRFGEVDGAGVHMDGDTVRTHSNAIVTTPAEGTVLFAGRFRSYEQLLILDVGDGYHIVLAGMSRINVSPGQSVLAGEPVGAMGEKRLSGTSVFGGADSEPVLYIEFRKDKKPVDPDQWWSDRNSGRTGNDT